MFHCTNYVCIFLGDLNGPRDGSDLSPIYMYVTSFNTKLWNSCSSSNNYDESEIEILQLLKCSVALQLSYRTSYTWRETFMVPHKKCSCGM